LEKPAASTLWAEQYTFYSSGSVHTVHDFRLLSQCS